LAFWSAGGYKLKGVDNFFIELIFAMRMSVPSM